MFERTEIDRDLFFRVLLIAGAVLYSLFIIEFLFLSVENPLSFFRGSEWLTFTSVLLVSSLVSWGISLSSKPLENIFDGMGSFFGGAAVVFFIGHFEWGYYDPYHFDLLFSAILLFGFFTILVGLLPEDRSKWTPVVLGSGFGISAQILGLFEYYLEIYPGESKILLAFFTFFFLSFLSAAVVFYSENSLSNIFKVQTAVAVFFSAMSFFYLVVERMIPEGSFVEDYAGLTFLLGIVLFSAGVGLGWFGYKKVSDWE